MPIYEYTCSKCQNVFEEWVKSATDPETDSCKCPLCGADSFRMISNTSFQLKGGGWFASSYPSANASSNVNTAQASNQASNPSNTTDKKENSSKVENKTDSK